MQEIFSPENRQALTDTLHNVRDLTGMLVGYSERIDALFSSVAQLAAQYRITPEEAALTVRHYGVQTARLLDSLSQQPGAGLSRLECAQIAFAVEHEMAEKLADLMFVSTYWGYERRWTEQTVAPFAAEMGRQLGWKEQRVSDEILSMPR